MQKARIIAGLSLAKRIAGRTDELALTIQTAIRQHVEAGANPKDFGHKLARQITVAAEEQRLAESAR